MRSIPLDPAVPALEVLFPTVGAPSFVAQMVQELTGTPVGPETAKLCRVQYRPTRDCVVLWSFPKPLDQPVLVSGLSSHRVGSEAARSVHDSAKIVCDTLGGRVYPYKHLPELQLFLQVFPLDIRLPGLAVAVSSTRARDAFSRCLGLSPSDVFVGEIEPVSYKPRRRCVLRYVVEVQGVPVQYFGKVFRDDRGESMVARLQGLKAQLLASGAPWDIAMPAMYVPEARMLVLAALEESVGMSALLKEACSYDPNAMQTLRQQIGTVAEGLFDFQSIAVEGLPCSGPHDMLRKLGEEMDGILQVAPVLAKSIQVLLNSLETAALRLPAEKMVLSHGAFRYNQFLSRRDTLLLIDLDTLCLSGASADAGEFLAYLDLTALRRPHRRPVVTDCQAVFLSSLLKHQCLDPRWIAWYRAASHVKWAQRTFFSLDSRWPELTDSLLHVADESLGGLLT